MRYQSKMMMSVPSLALDSADLEIPKSTGRLDVTHNCEYQVVWTTKFARPVLRGYHDDLRKVVLRAASEAGAEIRQLLIKDDVVSLTVKVDPTQGIHRAVTKMKSTSSSDLRKRYPELKSRVPSLWNSHYFVASLGAGANPETLKEFLEKQRRS